MRASFVALFIFPLACSPYAAPPTLPPPPPPPPTTSAAGPTSNRPVATAAETKEAAATEKPASTPASGESVAASETPVAFPAFEIEPPYLPGKYPRPVGRMAASLADEELARWNVGGSSQSAHPSNRPNYHPAPRVVVDLRPLGRALPERATKSRFASAASLLAEARNQGYWPFRTCYEQGLRESAELSGQVQVRVRVAPSGRVASARLRGSPLKSHHTVECVLRAASALTFKKPPARRVDADLSVKFWPGDAPLPPRDERVGVAWDPTAIAAAVSAESSDLARCCVDALARDPQLWGRLAFTVHTDSTGRVRESHETESRFPDSRASDCVREALARLSQLPATPAQFVVALRCGQPAAPRPAVPAEAIPSENSDAAAPEPGETGSLPARSPD
ncbi:MAG TPA: AgmX/PglI C-terminal domain-containing protein [Polyangiaceae bacterium]|nr:AgmX/PglI C-terminal domain-containing protein [Polyangiaceae bacterium]